MQVASVALARREQADAVIARSYSSVDGTRSWWPLVREPYAGAWQRNDEWTTDGVLANAAVFSCVTLIASDIGKLRPKLVQQGQNDIWSEVTSASFSPVLRKPNRFQTHIQFKESWVTSKLIRGNTYALKQRDARGVVTAMYLLDPTRVQVLVSDDGSVYYRLHKDNLSGLQEDDVVVPASEIIHDRMNCLFHPLVGISPIWACGMAANIGIKIEGNSASFFGKGSTPSGILTAPGVITQEQATEMSARWNANFSGDNAGKVAVLGNGLAFEQLRMTAVDSQLIEHLKWTDETVCRVFHVPAFKIGAGSMPQNSNGEILDQRYYSDCLQSHIEHMELCLDEGLGLSDPEKQGGKVMGVELDLDGLLRMDTATQMDTLVKGVRGGVLTPNGARRKIDEAPLTGGDTIYLQHQDYPMEMVFNRTDLSPKPEPDDEPDPDEPDPDEPPDEKERSGPLYWKAAEIDHVTKRAA